MNSSRPVLKLLTLLLLALAGSGCSTGVESGEASRAGSGEKIEIEHRRGKTAVPVSANRVVVFDLASLDTLNALGVDVLGVAGTVFPERLKQYGEPKYLKVGTLFEPDYEALNAANPDLIIVGGRSAAKYDDLAKLTPTVDLTISAEDYLASAESNTRTLAHLFGKTEQAEQQLTALRARIEAIAAKAENSGKALVILTTGGKMSAYGPGSRFGILYTDFGFTPSVEKLSASRHGEPVSFEFIAKVNPDWLFVIDRDRAIGEGGESAKTLLDNPLVKGTGAAQRGRIVYLNPTDWYLVGGGLGALQAMADEVHRALSPQTGPNS